MDQVVERPPPDPQPRRALQQVSTILTRKAVITWMIEDESFNIHMDFFQSFYCK
jgi:hypothetical protein